MSNQNRKINEINSIKLNVASTDKILEWSHGEVVSPETINYRTLKPTPGGLFCERIFGPLRDYECSCGKYKKTTYKGKTCERCGVDIVSSKVRRERKGHIFLEVPVVHPWHLKGSKYNLQNILGVKQGELDDVIFYKKYIVYRSEIEGLPVGSIINDLEREQYYQEFGIESFDCEKGGGAIRKILKNLDVKEEIKTIKKEIKATKSNDKKRKLNKKLMVLQDFTKSGNKPESLVLEAIPVIPPDLRPLVQLTGGKFAVSDLNELYRKVIQRNMRIKKMINDDSPIQILENEMRLLQMAVDRLLDNAKNQRQAKPGQKELKSLTENLKGKEGRFRQNLLGKRVDFSGRSVIVVGPDLKIDECGLPKEMALELFKPFVIAELIKREDVYNVRYAKQQIENRNDVVWEILERVVEGKKVLLNRAPTLHRLGIQAFKPKLVEGKAIHLSPLVCTGYNADFDGDQMAVHLPLTDVAQKEVTHLMLASRNILNPKDGTPIVAPSQDMVLGLYYLTLDRRTNNKVKIFKDPKEALLAYDKKAITLHEPIAIVAKAIDNAKILEEYKNHLLITTIGKYIFNNVTPSDYPYLNDNEMVSLDETPKHYFIPTSENPTTYIETMPIMGAIRKNDLSNIILDVFGKYGIEDAAAMVDEMKTLGYRHSSLSGISISYSDLGTVDNKEIILTAAQKEVDNLEELYLNGLITDEERYAKVTQEIWPKAKDQITEILIDSLDEDNNIFMMAESGARGNKSNFAQLGAMRGLMAAPSGKIIELPVKSSFKEGLSVLEFFISTHGARKGLVDTALNTAHSGYLTRKLVDVVQDVVVTEDDCQTERYDIITAISEGQEELTNLEDRIFGRTLQQEVVNSEGKVIAKPGDIIEDEVIKAIIETGQTEVKVRTISSCRAKSGICTKCYGHDLGSKKLVARGEAVGVIAAQSIGEPGTQLTMRTFHTGGVAGSDITQGLPRVLEIYEARNKDKIKGLALLAEASGKVCFYENNAEFLKDYPKVFYPSILYRHGLSKVNNELKHNRFWQTFSKIHNQSMKEAQKVMAEEMSKNKAVTKEIKDIALSIFNYRINPENLKERLIQLKLDKTNPEILKTIEEVSSQTMYNIYMEFYKIMKEIKIKQIYDLNLEIEDVQDVTGKLKALADYEIIIEFVTKTKEYKDSEVLEQLAAEKQTIASEKANIEKVLKIVEKYKKAILKDTDQLLELFVERIKGEPILDGYMQIHESEYRTVMGIKYLGSDRLKVVQPIPNKSKIIVKDKEIISLGDQITEGSIYLEELLNTKGLLAVKQYIIKEIQKIYRLQGVDINDKHIEIIIKQMLGFKEIIDSGDTGLILGSLQRTNTILNANIEAFKNGKKPALVETKVVSIIKSSLETDSFLSSASFQDTSRSLSEASLVGKTDYLRGLKENIIVGKKILAGTGIVDNYKGILDQYPELMQEEN